MVGFFARRDFSIEVQEGPGERKGKICNLFCFDQPGLDPGGFPSYIDCHDG
jgi:hypothetical protein